MIKSWRPKGLKAFFETGSKKGIQPSHQRRIQLILARLNVSTCAEDMDLPGLGLHPLKGERAEEFAVKVSGNWRIVFIFEGPDAYVVNYEDYH